MARVTHGRGEPSVAHSQTHVAPLLGHDMHPLGVHSGPVLCVLVANRWQRMGGGVRGGCARAAGRVLVGWWSAEAASPSSSIPTCSRGGRSRHPWSKEIGLLVARFKGKGQAAFPGGATAPKPTVPCERNDSEAERRLQHAADRWRPPPSARSLSPSLPSPRGAAAQPVTNEASRTHETAEPPFGAGGKAGEGVCIRNGVL